MGKGRPRSIFQELSERPGFRSTPEQMDWFRDASIAASETSLSEWLRKLAVAEGEKLLGTPCPRRQVMQPKPPAKRKKR